MLLKLLFMSTPWCFGPEEDEAAAKEASAKEAAAKAEAEKAKAEEKRFSQKDVDKAVGAVKFNLKKDLEKAENEARKLAEDKRLTQEERDSHAKRADELEQQYKTREQLAEENLKRQRESHQKENEALKTENKTIRENHNKLLIDVELNRGIVTADEAIPGKLAKFLRQDTVLTDEIDEKTGKPTGGQVVRINFDDKDKEGKPVKLVLSVEEAIKRMKELPDEYGIFFKGTATGGLGGGNAKGGSSASGSMPMDTESYIARKKAMKKG